MLNLVRHTNLCIHNSEGYTFLELTLLSYIPTLVYHLIVRNSCAFVFIDVYYSCGPSSHSISEWLGETNSSTSSISWTGQSSCIPQIKMPIQLLLCSTSEYYPFMSGLPWELHHLLWILDEVILLAIIIHSSITCCCNRNADKWTMMCEINTPSNLIAW